MADIKNIVDFEYKVSGAGEATAGMQKFAGAGIVVANMALQLAQELANVAGQIKAVFDETVAINSALYDGASAASMDVEVYQALDYMLRQSGGSAGDAANAMRALTSALAAGSEEASDKREALEALGLSYEEIMRMAPEDAFITITDSLKGLNSAQERNVAAAEIFGARFSQSIVCTMNQTTGSIKENVDALIESDLIISGDTVAAYEAFGDAQEELTQRLNVMKAEGLLPLIPVAEDMIKIWTDMAKNAGPKLADVLANLAFGFADVLKVVNSLNEAGKEIPEWLQTTAEWVQYAQNPLAAINARLQRFREEAEAANGSVIPLSQTLEDHAAILDSLDREQIDAAISAYSFAEAQMLMLAFATGLTPAFEAQIERVREMRAEMEAAREEAKGDVTVGRIDRGTGPAWTKDDREEEAEKAFLTEKQLLDMNRERLAVQQQMMEAARAGREEEVALMAEIADKEAAAFQERMAPLLSVAQQTTDILVSGMTRGFDNIGEQFQGMLKQMAADYLKSQIMRLLFNVGKKAGGFWL